MYLKIWILVIKRIVVKSPFLKKLYFLGVVCSVRVVIIKTGLIYSNRNRLKKWPFLDLIYSIHVVNIITGLSHTNRSHLKKWHFLNLVCSVSLVTITIGISCSNTSRHKKWHYPDLVCSVYGWFHPGRRMTAKKMSPVFSTAKFKPQ